MSDDAQQAQMRATLLLPIEEACHFAGIRGDKAAKGLQEMGWLRFAEIVTKSKKELQAATGVGADAANRLEKLALENFLQLEMAPKLVAEVIGEPTLQMRAQWLRAFRSKPISRMGLSRNAYHYLYRNKVRDGATLLELSGLPGPPSRGKDTKAEIAQMMEREGVRFGITEEEIVAEETARTPEPIHTTGPTGGPPAGPQRQRTRSTGDIVAGLAADRPLDEPTRAREIQERGLVIEAWTQVLEGLGPEAVADIRARALASFQFLVRRDAALNGINEDQAAKMLQTFSQVYGASDRRAATELGRFAHMLWGMASRNKPE